MKPTRETYTLAAAFALLEGYDKLSYECEYGDGVVYYATCAALENSCSGYPLFVIVTNGNDGMECRYSTPDETLEIMGREK